MKTKSIFAVALAAIVAFSSCSKEDNNSNLKAGETTRVILNVERALETRGSGATVAKHAVEFTDGWLVFADGSNKATNIFKIVTTAPNDGEINMAGTLDLDDISGESRSVYILGNVASITAIAVGTDMAALVATTTTAKSQTNSVSASSVAGVTLYGKAATINHSVTPSTAKVSVTPVSSRVEIHKFTGSGEVDAYKVEFIGMNNFYDKITYAGDFSSAADKDKLYLGKADATKFTSGGAAQYTDAGYFFDEDKTNGLGTLAAKVLTPAAGTVWAYNVPAPKTGEFPHIVIRVSGVTGVNGLDASDIRYMTVTKFIYDGGANDGDDVPAFEAGKIYKITNFLFDEENLDVNPEMKTVAAKVTVELAEWDPINVKPW